MAQIALAMELEVNSEAVAVETVEVVAGGEDDGSASLMEQQLIAASAQELIVPTSEVQVVNTYVYSRLSSHCGEGPVHAPPAPSTILYWVETYVRIRAQFAAACNVAFSLSSGALCECSTRWPRRLWR